MTPLSSLRRAAYAGAFLLGLSALPAHSATFTVTNLNDSGVGSLRQALIEANTATGDDVVTFAPSLTGTIALASPLRVSGGVTITGPGADKLTLDGKGTVQGIVFSSGTSSLSGLTIANAFVGAPTMGAGLLNESVSALTLSQCRFANNKTRAGQGLYGSGGAIANIGVLKIKQCSFEKNTAGAVGGGAIYNANNLTVSDSTFRDNSAHLGGAIYNSNTLALSNSTFDGNRVSSRTASESGTSYVFSGLGSAVYTQQIANVTNCTLFNNTVTGQTSSPSGEGENRPGAIYNVKGLLSLVNCTLSGNTDARTGASADVRIGTLVNLDRVSCLNTVFVSSQSRPFFGFAAPPSGGDDKSNFFFATNQSAGLDALRSNGGAVATMALLGTSPLRDAGHDLGSPPDDARGEFRPYGAGIDVGAFEAQDAPTPPTLSVNSPSIKEGNSGQTSLVFTLTLSRASVQTVSVLVNTAQGTAKAGSDYQSVPRGTVIFPPGTTKQTFTVKIVGDTIAESNEQFQLTMRSPVNATLATPSGTGTILNDDGAPIADSASSA